MTTFVHILFVLITAILKGLVAAFFLLFSKAFLAIVIVVFIVFLILAITEVITIDLFRRNRK